jgi:hypothetical protein
MRAATDEHLYGEVVGDAAPWPDDVGGALSEAKASIDEVMQASSHVALLFEPDSETDVESSAVLHALHDAFEALQEWPHSVRNDPGLAAFNDRFGAAIDSHKRLVAAARRVIFPMPVWNRFRVRLWH